MGDLKQVHRMKLEEVAEEWKTKLISLVNTYEAEKEEADKRIASLEQ